MARPSRLMIRPMIFWICILVFFWCENIVANTTIECYVVIFLQFLYKLLYEDHWQIYQSYWRDTYMVLVVPYLYDNEQWSSIFLHHSLHHRHYISTHRECLMIPVGLNPYTFDAFLWTAPHYLRQKLWDPSWGYLTPWRDNCRQEWTKNMQNMVFFKIFYV